MSVGSYLRLRGGTYHFRVRVPQPLRAILNRAELVVSLRTGRFAVAVRAARAIRVGLDEIMTAIEQGLTQSEIDRRIRVWISELAYDWHSQLATNDGRTGIFHAEEMDRMDPDQATELDRLMKVVLITETEKAKAVLVQAASGGVLTDSAIDSLVAAAATRTDLDFEPQTKDGKILRSLVIRNLQALIDAANAIAKGKPIPDQIVDWMQRNYPRPIF